jgi:hypothetical protein
MLNNAFRKELIKLMAAQKTDRIPALRRSRMTEWTYATDITLLLSAKATYQLKKTLQDSGWEYSEENGWLQLRKSAAEPPEGWFCGPFGQEAACCRSILERHPEKTGCADETAQRELIKAGEAGEESYEEVCGELHRKWAECLRKGEPIPALSMKYFIG